MRFTDNYLFDARIYDLSLAHGAAGGMWHYFSCIRVDADKIQHSAYHIGTPCADYAVCLGMNRTAHFISLAARYVMLSAQAIFQVNAVFSASGRAVVAGRYNLIIFHNNRSEIPAQTSSPFTHSLRNVEVIIRFVTSLRGIQ